MDNFSEDEFQELRTVRRRKLLPWWIKAFCWFFMLFGLMAFICLFLGFTNIKPFLAFYGLETNEPFSIEGLIIIGVGILKGITGFLLWFEKDAAIELGKIDAVVGIVLCGLSMFILPFIQDEFHLVLRLELILLIPYLIKLNKIKAEWKASAVI